MATTKSNQPLEQLFEGMTFSQFMDLIPGHIYIKDRDGVFLGSNKSVDSQAQMKVEGKTDYDMPWKNEANKMRENDKKVMDSKKQAVFLEKGRSNSGQVVTFCSVKAPLYDKKGNVIGIIGHSIELDQG